MSLTPSGFDPAAFTAHAQVFLDGWLRDFAWADQVLAGAITSIVGVPVDAEHEFEGPSMILWERNPATPTWLVGLKEALSPNESAEEAMLDDPFNERWDDAVEGYALTGTWLHPESRLEVDGYSWATSRAAFHVGVFDQNNPTDPRRYDADLDPFSKDIGVVSFPVRADYRVPYWVGKGYSPARAGLYAVLVALAEAGCHEAMEMHQGATGAPVWSPHDRNYHMTLRVTLTDGFVTEASPH